MGVISGYKGQENGTSKHVDRAAPDYRERDSVWVEGFHGFSFWFIMRRPARVRGRKNFGAFCPYRSLAREAATLSLVTRIGLGRCVDPVGEIGEGKGDIQDFFDVILLAKRSTLAYLWFPCPVPREPLLAISATLC